MSGNRINRGGRPIPGAVNAEFTPGQIVVGICVLIFAAVIFFLAGVLVGKYDPTVAEVIDTTKPAEIVTETPLIRPAEKSVPPTQTASATPPPTSNPTPPSNPSPPPITAAADLKKESSSLGPRTVDLPPLSSAKSPSGTVEVPVKMSPPLIPDAPDPSTSNKTDTKSASKSATDSLPPLPGSSKTEAKPAMAEEKTQTASKTGAKPPVGYLEAELADELLESIGGPENAPTKSTASTKKEPGSSTKSAPAGSASGYGIQVGSFSKETREEQANSVKRSLEAAGLTAEVRPTKDKSMYRVLVVGFPDRASAIKALDDLKQRPGFEKAFIQDLSRL